MCHIFLFVHILDFWRGDHCKLILNVIFLRVVTMNLKFTRSAYIFKVISGNLSILTILESAHKSTEDYR